MGGAPSEPPLLGSFWIGHHISAPWWFNIASSLRHPTALRGVARIRETLCESGRCIDALKKRRRVLKKRGRVLKKRGRVLKKLGLVRGTASAEGGGGFLRGGRGS